MNEHCWRSQVPSCLWQIAYSFTYFFISLLLLLLSVISREKDGMAVLSSF